MPDQSGCRAEGIGPITGRTVQFALVAALVGVALAVAVVVPSARASDGWSSSGALGQPQEITTASLLNDGSVLIANGAGGGPVIYAERFDPSTGSWVAAGTLATPRSGYTQTTLANGTVMVAGGFGQTYLNTTEIYNPATNQWLPGPTMGTARSNASAVRLNDGRVLIAGGSGGPILRSAEIYDPSSGTWAPTGSMTTARTEGSMTLLADGRVLVVGGFNGAEYVDTAEVFDPSTGTWSAAGQLTTGRYGQMAIRLNDGRVLVAGGFGNNTSPNFLASAQIYDPSLNSWSSAASLGIPRINSGAALLPNGRVLVVAGDPQTTNSKTTEIYDPVADSWSPGPALGTGRSRMATLSLSDGRVITIGGSISGGSGYTSTTEIFGPIPPNTTVTSGPSGRTAANMPSFGFSSTVAGSTFECRFDAAAFGPCSGPGATHTPAGALSDGDHSFSVRATDPTGITDYPGGNTDQTPATRSFTVDTQAPETSVDTGPSGPGNDNTPTFGFSSTEAGSSFECRFDANSFAFCSGPGATHTANPALLDGAHTFSVRATDDVGNTDQTSATRTFSIDTQPPETTIDSGPTGPTTETTPSFGFSSSEVGSTFECRIDNDPFGPCSGLGATHTAAAPLSDGAHSFSVRATDTVGNTDPTSAIRSFTIDTTPPETSIASGPSGPTNDSTPSFGFTSNEPGSNFECRFDTDAFGPCSGPGATHTPATALSDGAHSFSVRATDDVGNTDLTPATGSFTVDTQAPDTTIDSGPSGPGNDSTPTFGFSSTEAGSSFECRFDANPFGPCSGPGATHTANPALLDGTHTFSVRATDDAGNTDQTSATRSFGIDTQSPETTIDSGPAGPNNDATPTFGFSSSEAGSAFECRFDSDPFGPCSGPGATDTPSGALSEGPHSFAVRATDGVGNTDPAPATRNWTVDLTPPHLTITSGPSGVSNQTHASLAFAADEAGVTFECRLDGAGFQPCDSPVTYSALDDGQHTVDVRGTDPAGNPGTAPATRTWTVDPGSSTSTTSGSVGPGGSVSTDPAGSGPTAAQPVTAAVTLPNGGDVQTVQQAVTTTPPAGYSVLGQQFQITAPDATPEAPLILTFRLNASALPDGAGPSSLTLLRDDHPAADCSGPPGTATPDPCVSSRLQLPDGDIVISVLSSHASTWNIAKRPRCVVPALRGKNLKAARTKLRHARCALGTVRHRRTGKKKRGKILSQVSRAGTIHPPGFKVGVVVGRAG